MKIQPSKELAYWVGLVQSDGYFKKYEIKNGKTRNSIVFQVAPTSLPMIHRFKSISKKLFKRSASIFKINTRNAYQYSIGVKKLLRTFQELDIRFDGFTSPPKWCIKNSQLFGAYLAGLIDGDGDIRIKRPKYPQCIIRISGGKNQTILSEIIESVLNCSVHITYKHRSTTLNGRRILGSSYDLEFYVSAKNYEFIREFVIPHLALQHKKLKLQSFIKKF